MTLYQLDEKTQKIVPIEATRESEAKALLETLRYHDQDILWWYAHMPKDLFRIAYRTMIDNSPEVLPLDIAKIAQGLKRSRRNQKGFAKEWVYNRNFNAGIDALAAAIAKLSGNETVGGV